MGRPLKDVLAKKAKPVEEPSLFCFDLLRIADASEPIALAIPTDVSLE